MSTLLLVAVCVSSGVHYRLSPKPQSTIETVKSRLCSAVRSGPDDPEANVHASRHAASAGEDGLADAVAGPALIGVDCTGAYLKATRPFAFFGKSGRLPRERRTAQIAMQSRFKLLTMN